MIKRVFIILLILLSPFSMAFSQSVANTVHNLSVTGPGTVKAVSETEICIFCHTPHDSKPSSPLWNKEDPGMAYVLYGSSTAQALPGQPDGSSILCLSCHDGTIALGNVLSRTDDITFAGGITRMPAGRTNLTTDLSDDHPVSFLYSAALASADGQLRDPASVMHPVVVEDGKIQCRSCHDPHRNIYSDFLVASNQFSGLCISCHDRSFWSSSSHNTSTASWNGTGTDPWYHTSFTTVAENGCESCHNPHKAGGRDRLMNYQEEESNCLNCHNGNVASTNISIELTKPYLHNVFGYNLSHDAAETLPASVMHAECVDCHNPHAVTNETASAPAANGFLYGVRGINQVGSPVDPVQFEYEICYKCHADSPLKPSSHTIRQIEQNNVRLEFDLSSTSYHPVTGVGKNMDSPSLIAPVYTETSIIYCTDCHASNGSGAPAGPHGSIYPTLLKYRYMKADNTPKSASSYELCYSCHNRASILSDNSFSYHKKHVSEEDTPCNVCHDPHGISSAQGNPMNNSHLINFDISIVGSAGSGFLRFVDTGINSGYCLLRCHGKTHTFSMSY